MTRRTFVNRLVQQRLLDDQERGVRVGLKASALLHDERVSLPDRLDKLEAILRAELKGTGVDPGTSRVAWVGPELKDPLWRTGPGFDILDALEAIDQARAALASGSAEASLLAGHALARRLANVGRGLGLRDRSVGAKCRESAPHGGRERAPKEDDRERWSRWRAKEEALRRGKPTYSRNRIAGLIAEEEGVSASTVREVLRGRRGKA